MTARFLRLRSIAPVAITALVVLAPHATLAAASPAPVRISLAADFLTGDESFTATGGFCSDGTATSSGLGIVGGGNALSFHVTKTLECGDGSGSLVIRVNAATHGGSDHDQGGWSVVSGTGAWAGASGGGNLVGTYVPDGVIDLYTGVLAS